MVRTAILGSLIWTVAIQGGLAQEWARKMFKVTSHDFGTLVRGATPRFEFELTNLYEEDIHIASVRSTCGCTTPSITKQTLKTWETGAIVATFHTQSFVGSKNATITVIFDKPYYAEVQLTVVGSIRGDVVFEPSLIDFGTVNQGTSTQMSVNVSRSGRTDWRIVDIRSANTNLQVELTETQRSAGRVNYDMIVHLKGTAPPGYLQDQLTILTNDNQSKVIPIEVKGRIVTSLTVSPASLFLGVLTSGQTVTKTLVVRGQQPFRVTGIHCKDHGFEFKPSNDAKVLHVIPVTFTASGHAGRVEQPIEIHTDLGPGTAAQCIATATIRP